jgi:hypothetical protein
MYPLMKELTVEGGRPRDGPGVDSTNLNFGPEKKLQKLSS